MKNGPDIARVAALIGDPARANMLTALSGKALTATELSQEAGVTRQTASTHLQQLVAGGLLTRRSQGRSRYFALASSEVAGLLETLMGVALGAGHLRLRPGPRDQALREARVCYNHLAGARGVQMYEALRRQGRLHVGEAGVVLTPAGERFIARLGLDVAALQPDRARPPLCRECLDWSERRAHLAGRLGRALFAHMEGAGWLRRVPDSRAVRFTPQGARRFTEAFGPSATDGA